MPKRTKDDREKLFAEYKAAKQTLDEAKEHLEYLREKLRELVTKKPKDAHGRQRILEGGLNILYAPRITAKLSKDAVNVLEKEGYGDAITTVMQKKVDEERLERLIEDDVIPDHILSKIIEEKTSYQLRIQEDNGDTELKD